MCHVKFKSDGQHFSWKKPVTTVHNILVGGLFVDQEGDVVVTNHFTREQCIVHFQPAKKVQDDYKRLTGEVRDVEGHVSYRILGAWDTGLELISVDDVCCQTDCRIRTDIRLLECGKIDASANEKHRLEERQRASRRQRDLTGEAWSPRWFVPKEDTDSGTFCYMYKGGYWKARLKGQYPDSPYIY
ncbi:Oxysterol-binding protein 2 [Acropora cervicornis]|uniref:Oxysterol-binding protein 2 n=1 Tax=Acropora cervicornis TaxID=6130 RepID=A0AAD9Q0T2_ACRCE|nr:Oxysterol-binding protein 2 [Acropora cervicornis]